MSYLEGAQPTAGLHWLQHAPHALQAKAGQLGLAIVDAVREQKRARLVRVRVRVGVGVGAALGMREQERPCAPGVGSPHRPPSAAAATGVRAGPG